MLRRSSARVWAALLVATFSAALGAGCGSSSSPSPTVDPEAAEGPVGALSHEGRWLTDETGRAVLLHGVNFVQKFPPIPPAEVGFGVGAAPANPREVGAARLLESEQVDASVGAWADDDIVLSERREGLVEHRSVEARHIGGCHQQWPAARARTPDCVVEAQAEGAASRLLDPAHPVVELHHRLG